MAVFTFARGGVCVMGAEDGPLCLAMVVGVEESLVILAEVFLGRRVKKVV